MLARQDGRGEMRASRIVRVERFTIQRLHRPFTESGPLMFLPCAGGKGAFTPQVGSSGLLMPGVPYQTTLIRPSSPAAIQAKTLLCNAPSDEAEVSIWIGADQPFPSFVEKEYFRTVSPVMLPLASMGASSQTA